MPQEILSLGIYREGFVNRGATLYNKLPGNLKSETNSEEFRRMAKEVIKLMIP